MYTLLHTKKADSGGYLGMLVDFGGVETPMNPGQSDNDGRLRKSSLTFDQQDHTALNLLNSFDGRLVAAFRQPAIPRA
jgi:hypothetical protein